MLLDLLVTVVLTLLITGVFMWGIDNFPWISGDFKAAAKVVIVVIVAIWLLSVIAGIVPRPIHYFR